MNKNLSYKMGKIKDKKTSAWLVTVIKFMNYSGYMDLLKILEVKMKEVKYTVLQKLMTIICSIVVDCSYTKDINTKLSPDTVAADLLEMEKFPDQSQINILLRRFTEENIDQLKKVHNKMLKQDGLSNSTKENIVIDIEQSDWGNEREAAVYCKLAGNLLHDSIKPLENSELII